MNGPYTNSTDATLDILRELRLDTDIKIYEFYQAIRQAKSNGYSYDEIETVTGLGRGTIQAIIANKNPRLTPNIE